MKNACIFSVAVFLAFLFSPAAQAMASSPVSGDSETAKASDTAVSAKSHGGPEKLLGRDWLKISRQRKIYFIFAAEESFPAKGVTFKPAGDYIELMDRKISGNPALRDKSADKIFHDVVMETSRPQKTQGGPDAL